MSRDDSGVMSSSGIFAHGGVGSRLRFGARVCERVSGASDGVIDASNSDM